MSDKFKDDETFLARWLNGDLSKDELSEFEKSDDFLAYKRIADKVSILDTPKWDKEAIWKEVSDKGGIRKEKKTNNVRWLNTKWMRYAGAACVLAILGYLALFNNDGLEVHQTYAAQTQTVNLPDGSIAYLNADSELSFDPKSFNNERSLNLEGEAFFEVEKGAKFTIFTDNGAVRVLGTSFNVRTRERNLDVQCFTGRVGVSFDDFKNEEVLVGGDMLTSSKRKVKNKSSLAGDLIGPEWREGRSKFTNVRFVEVLNEIERQFDVEIIVDEAAKRIDGFNGGFSHDDLRLALEVVCASVNYDFKIDGKTVELSLKK